MKLIITFFLSITLTISNFDITHSLFNNFNKNKKIRARDIGIPLDGITGKYNSITDIDGIEVGHVTIIKGKGNLKVGDGPIRTGVTAILPRGKTYDPVFAGWYSLNGNGEMTGDNMGRRIWFFRRTNYDNKYT